jgi:hypothetical protein
VLHPVCANYYPAVTISPPTTQPTLPLPLFFYCVVQSPELWNPVLVSFYPTAAAASIAINVVTLQSAFQQAGAESFSAGLQGIWGFSTPKTPASWGYTFAIGLYIATGGCLQQDACACVPHDLEWLAFQGYFSLHANPLSEGLTIAAVRCALNLPCRSQHNSVTSCH